jgi:hypothetical protein
MRQTVQRRSESDSSLRISQLVAQRRHDGGSSRSAATMRATSKDDGTAVTAQHSTAGAHE